jgi:regulator of G-protein signaling
VKKWSIGLEELLKDPAGLEEFHVFLEKEFSSENIQFWLAVKFLKCLPLSQVEARARSIYQ